MDDMEPLKRLPAKQDFIIQIGTDEGLNCSSVTIVGEIKGDGSIAKHRFIRSVENGFLLPCINPNAIVIGNIVTDDGLAASGIGENIMLKIFFI